MMVAAVVGKELMHAKEGQREIGGRREGGGDCGGRKTKGEREGGREGRVRVVYGRRINRRETI